MKLNFYSIFITALILPIASHSINKNTGAGLLPSAGGTPMQIMLYAPSHFLQEDERWANEKIGGCEQKIKDIGCTLCALTMALNGLGTQTNPKELNALLRQNSGYTSRGWLVWGAVNKIFPSLMADVVTRPSLQKIDELLVNNRYPIIKFMLPENIPHWVVIIGKHGQEYIILDPLNSYGKSYLSESTSYIYSVRYAKRLN